MLVGKAFGDWLTTFPQWIMDLFAIAGGILPALGIGMLLNYLGKKKIIPFFFLGLRWRSSWSEHDDDHRSRRDRRLPAHNFSDKTAKKVGA